MKLLLSKFSFVLAGILVMGSGCVLQTPLATNSQNILVQPDVDSRAFFIAHAGGSAVLDGEYVTGTNSKESFEAAYDQGFRFFEFDFSLTHDDEMVVFHDGAEPHIKADKKIDEMTRDEFLSHSFFDRYTLMDLSHLVELLIIHPDIYIVTDFKSDFESSLDFLDNLPRAIRVRFIIQMYEFEQINILKDRGYSNIILTLYRIQDIPDDVVIDFITTHPEIDAVTIRYPERYNDILAQRIGELGRRVYVHTVNDESIVRALLQNGVGVYTDYVYLAEG